MPFYQVNFSKSQAVIRISPIEKVFLRDSEIKKRLERGESIYYNENYILTPTRKDAREIASLKRLEWISEYREKIDKLADLKI